MPEADKSRFTASGRPATLWLVNRFRVVFLLIIAASALFPAGAQSPAEEPSPEVPAVSEGESSGEPEDWPGEEAVVALDIAGSGYYELVAWVRRLGLPETGGVEELRNRLYAHYKVEAPESATRGTVIRIESADKTEYFTLENVGEEYVRLSGGVSLAFTESETGVTHRIQADEVVYNRTKNILSARGEVEYEKSGASGRETFYGQTITVDLDSWEGRFLDGRSVRSSGEGKTASSLAFQADEIRKLEGGVLALKDGLVTSSAAEDPYWSVRASRIWLFGDNEWALANAVLSVGNVPVLYLPAFYYPGQEIVFHPSIGYRAREGRFVQTTTYLIGTKTESSDDKDSLNIFKTSSNQGNEKELKGVFLLPTDKARKTKNKDTLKVLADIYSSLGAHVGLEGVFASRGVFESLDFSVGLGFSRSIFSDSGYYTPYSDSGGYESVWNHSSFWGIELPFRYKLGFNAKLSLGTLSAAVALPLFSDPFFEEDFTDRSEDMNWLKIMRGETSNSDIGETSSFSQKLTLSGSIPIKGLSPWVSSVSLDSFTSSLYWKPLESPTPTTEPDATLYDVDPMRKFFAPELLTVADAAFTLRGELYAFGAGATGSPQPAGDGKSETPTAADVIEAPWDEPETDAAEGEGKAAGKDASAVEYGLAPPSPSANALASSPQSQGLSGGISYTITPSGSYERRFPTSYWDEPSDVNMQGLYDLASYKLSAAVTAKASWDKSLLSSSLVLGWVSQAQSRSNIDEDASHVSTSQRESWAEQDAQYRYERLTGTFKLSSSPFQNVWLFSPTSLSYTLSSYLYNTEYEDGSAITPAGPAYDVSGPQWSTDSIKTHSLAMTLGAQPYGYLQSFTLTSTLPPRLESYTLDAKLNVPWVALQGSTKYYRSAEGTDLVWDDLTAKLTAGSSRGGPKLSNQFVWDIQENEPASNTTTFTWGGFSASLGAGQSKSYTLDPDSGWVEDGAKAFRLTNASASYKKTFDLPLFRAGAAKFKGNLDAQFSQSLVKATDSVLALTYGITITIPKILDLTISGTSQNSSVWRYAPSWFGMSTVGTQTIEPVNIFKDLFNSLSIWDAAALRSALFKIKGLTIKATHYMEDWDLVFQYKGEPELNTSSTPYRYEFVSSFTLLLTWKAVPQITSSVIKDDSGFRTE